MELIQTLVATKSMAVLNGMIRNLRFYIEFMTINLTQNSMTLTLMVYGIMQIANQ